MTECWLSVAADSLSSPAVTPLSSTVGHVQSTPSLWSLALSLWSLALSLWSVAGSIPVTTINKTITNSCTIQTCSDVSVNC